MDTATNAPKSLQAGPGDRAWIAPAYFLVYLAYLFMTLEGEWGHWVTMVLIPVGIVTAGAGGGPGRLRRALGSLGLGREGMRRGLGLTLGLAVAVCLFQVAYSRYSEAIVEVLTSWQALVKLPLALVFLLLTAALTEEVFFRGYLQTRLERLSGSRWAGLVLASVLFGFYHLPYAYLHPRWPSHGDWSEAFIASLGQGIPGGLILGGLFLYTRRNLLAPVLLHAAINLLPATTLIKFSSG